MAVTEEQVAAAEAKREITPAEAAAIREVNELPPAAGGALTPAGETVVTPPAAVAGLSLLPSATNIRPLVDPRGAPLTDVLPPALPAPGPTEGVDITGGIGERFAALPGQIAADPFGAVMALRTGDLRRLGGGSEAAPAAPETVAAEDIVSATAAPAAIPAEAPPPAATVGPAEPEAQGGFGGTSQVVADIRPEPVRVGGQTIEEIQAEVDRILAGEGTPEAKITAIEELRKLRTLQEEGAQAGVAATEALVTETQKAQGVVQTAAGARAESERLRQEGLRGVEGMFVEESGQIREQQNRERQEAQGAIKGIRDAEAGTIALSETLFEKFRTDDNAITEELKTTKQADFWDDKSVGDRILASISLFLGGLGAGLTGTPNFALQIIESEIARDVERQKEEFNRLESRQQALRSGYALRSNRTTALLDQYQRQEGQIYNDLNNNLALAESLRTITPEIIDIKRSGAADARINDAAIFADALRVADNMVETLKLTQAGEEAKGRADLLQQELRVRIADKIDAANVEVARLAQRDREFRAQAYIGTVNQLAADQRNRETIAAQNQRALLGAVVTTRGQDIAAEKEAGRLGLALAIEARLGTGSSDPLANMPNNAKLQVADLDGLAINLDQLERDFNEDTGPFSLLTQFIPGTPSAIFNKKQQLFVTEFLKAMQGSRPSDFDMKVYREIIPQAKTLGWTADAMFQQLREQLANRRAALVNAFQAQGNAGVQAQMTAFEQTSNREFTLADGTKGFVSEGFLGDPFQFTPDVAPAEEATPIPTL